MRIELLNIFLGEAAIIVLSALVLSVTTGYVWYCCSMERVEDALWSMFLFLIPFIMLIDFAAKFTFAVMSDA